MAEALQFFVHRPQLTHFEPSMRTFSHEKRARKLSIVPTGHIVLQYVLPPRQASTAMTTSVSEATTSVGRLFIHTSTL